MSTLGHLWRLVRFSGRYFLTDMSTATVYWLSHTVLGLLLRAFFNFLTGEAGFSLSINAVIGLQIGYAVIGSISLTAAILANTGMRYRSMSLMIRNMFARILQMPGAQPLPIGQKGKPMSSGEVISTFRDDTNELVNAITTIEDTLGMGITAFISAAIMIRISPTVTLGTFLPLGVIILVAERLGPLVKKYRKASREATAQVTGAIADIFNNTQAIKVGNAEDRIVDHFRRLNDQRLKAMVRDKLLTDLVNALSNGALDVGLGLILLLAARAMYSGDFTIGDFALFAAYIWPMTQLMRMVGGVLTLYRQSGVSIQRMEMIMQGAEVGAAFEHHPVYLNGPLPLMPFMPKKDAYPLQRFGILGLTFHYDSSDGAGKGVEDVTLDLPAGTLTVITGRVGSGKTTLLKTILGLLPASSGQILWNEKPVADPATFFVPPRCAYTGQVPRLFSETMQDNILLGLPEDGVDLTGAIRAAVLEKDLKGMGAGLSTLVGPRGVRLSGGQIQRTAAARMFARDAELLLFDDLSSALDVETEQLLWERIFERETLPTCLVVSHRKAVLSRADHIVVLKDGKVEDEGQLSELLERCEEMRRLWAVEDA
jgi:ATP-binding cassette subfamily B protein